MSTAKIISSLQNPLIKNIGSLLEKARERRKQGLLVAEGLIEVGMALRGGFTVEQLLYNPDLTPEESIQQVLKHQPAAAQHLIQVSGAVMEKVAYRANVPNVVAVLRSKSLDLNEFKVKANPLILVLETVEKPGNLGAILRTADAAGVDAVLLCDPQTDWYNPNVIRASLGAVFTVPIFSTTAAEALEWLQKHQIRIFATHLEASYPYYDCDLQGPTALVMGTEADGISTFWVQNAHQRVIIPMQGLVDSMNVSVSTAILLFEALRQRK
ncbi:MAG: RNA methyltransferase [Haliscomenobacter sp.]|uniref:RNA methyltransferase n=1 Tax=Haliscomenobacter sp. TaxID=2717303 RepID=UPI0029A1FAD1|nr:RNA methyltransferase [Haliscomenobacter sp.]MDX2072127.1 RNA methyltransferase [Haliscomenobacter sp.]